MTDNTQLDSTPDAEVVNTPQASESAKPETISETIARSLQELNPQEEKVDTDAEIPNPDQPQDIYMPIAFDVSANSLSLRLQISSWMAFIRVAFLLLLRFKRLSTSSRMLPICLFAVPSFG